MEKVAVFATLRISTEARQHVLAQLLAHRERCLRDEPGTLMFEIMLPRGSDNTAHLYEVYESQSAFETHWNGASIAQLRSAVGDALEIVDGLWGVPVEAA